MAGERWDGECDAAPLKGGGDDNREGLFKKGCECNGMTAEEIEHMTTASVIDDV